MELRRLVVLYIFIKSCFDICCTRTHIIFTVVLVDLVVKVHLVVLKCSMIWVMADMEDMSMMEEWRSKYLLKYNISAHSPLLLQLLLKCHRFCQPLYI